MENKGASSEVRIKRIIKTLDSKAYIIGLLGLIAIILIPIFVIDHFIFDYPSTGSLGDTIGGLSAPIIGFFSALLIYLSFRAQIKANYIVQSQIERQENSEKEKKEIEFINNLMTQFINEIYEFTSIKYEGSFENGHNVTYHGTEALKIYLNQLSAAFEHYRENEMEFFNNSTNRQYLGLLDMLDKLIQIVKEANIKLTDKEYFKSQIRYLFDYKLTLLPNRQIFRCEACDEDHILLPCVLHKIIKGIEEKIELI